MTKSILALAALSTSAVLALGAPALSASASASQGGDDGPGDVHGSHGGGGGGNDGRVIKTGTCSDGAQWKLKVNSDDRGLEVEGEVDSNQAGQTWAWRIKDNGATAAQGSSTTGGRSGSFSVERRISDKAGTDTIVFRATRQGEVCTGTIGF